MSRHLKAAGGDRIAREAGFTVIEVVIAAALLAIASLAVLGLVDAANRNNLRASQSQVVNDRLQQQMEAIKQLPYNQVALTRLPSSSTDPSTPASRVTASTFNVKRTGAANCENLVYNGSTAPGDGSAVTGGSVDPGPTPFQNGSVKGNIYRYVTWEADPACGNDTQSNCGERYYKRVVIDITLDQTASGGPRVYQEIQGYVSNPNAGLPASQGGQGGQNEGGGGTGHGGQDTPTPWTFWLTDTSCSQEPPAETRQPITADHETHNTLAICPSGQQTGATPGSPDLMLTEAAPCSDGTCDNPQPLYDYATDVEPDVQPDQDRGLQELAPPDPGHLGCTVDITTMTGPLGLNQLGSTPTQATPWLYIHKWLSPPVPNGSSDVVLDGTGSLDLWTQSINGVPYPGAVCVWLFVRTVTGGIPLDTLAVNLDQSGNPAYFRYSQGTWPTTAWSEISVPLHFASLNVPGGLAAAPRARGIAPRPCDRRRGPGHVSEHRASVHV